MPNSVWSRLVLVAEGSVLQFVSAYPDLVKAWAVVDPQPARDQAAETNAFQPTAFKIDNEDDDENENDWGSGLRRV
jgi:hypothetical protein